MLGRSEPVLAHSYSLPTMPSFSMSASLPVQVRTLLRLKQASEPLAESAAALPDVQPGLVLLHAARQPCREWEELRDIYSAPHAAAHQQSANGVLCCVLDG